MRVLLTGGTGFLGPATARALVEAGHEVRCLVRHRADRSGLQALSLPLEFAIGDVTDPGSLPPALAERDAVVHLAGLTKALDPRAFAQVNVTGTENLAHAAEAARARRFVHASSLAAVGPIRAGRPADEADAPAPVSHYGRSKLGAEELLRRRASTLAITVVRPPIVYGPRDRDFLEVFRLASRPVALQAGVLARKHYSIAYVDDVARALALALDRGRTLREGDRGEGVYHVSDGGVYAWDELLRAVGRALGRARTRVLPVPEALSWPLGVWGELEARWRGRPGIVSLDKVRELPGFGWACRTERARSELGFTPAWPLERGLREAADWYRRHAWL